MSYRPRWKGWQLSFKKQINNIVATEADLDQAAYSAKILCLFFEFIYKSGSLFKSTLSFSQMNDYKFSD